MLLYLALSFAFPVPVLLIVCGALGAGAMAARWFAVEQEHTRQGHAVRVVIEPDTEPELIEKVG